MIIILKEKQTGLSIGVIELQGKLNARRNLV